MVPSSAGRGRFRVWGLPTAEDAVFLIRFWRHFSLRPRRRHRNLLRFALTLSRRRSMAPIEPHAARRGPGFGLNRGPEAGLRLISEGARVTSPRREIRRIRPNRSFTFALRCPRNCEGSRARVPIFAGFSRECRESQTTWRRGAQRVRRSQPAWWREGDLNPRAPSDFGLLKTPRVRPIILRSFSETSHREFIRHRFDTFQTYAVPAVALT
jgi:hypothetical protein